MNLTTDGRVLSRTGGMPPAAFPDASRTPSWST
jgi:hypothetical protein